MHIRDLLETLQYLEGSKDIYTFNNKGVDCCKDGFFNKAIGKFNFAITSISKDNDCMPLEIELATVYYNLAITKIISACFDLNHSVTISVKSEFKSGDDFKNRLEIIENAIKQIHQLNPTKNI